MENKIFRKSISVDHVFYGFDPEIGLHFYFHYKPFLGPKCAKRDREKEREEKVTDPPKTNRTPTLAPPTPQHRRRHLDRTTTKIAPQTNRTPPRSHHHRRPIHPKPISSASSLPMTDLVSISSPSRRYLWPISLPSRSRHYPWSISSRSRHLWRMTDLSLSLNFWSLSLPPSLGLTELWTLMNSVVLIFVFLRLYIEIFYYKICLVAEKINEKMWKSSRKIAFSECNQTHENIF